MESEYLVIIWCEYLIMHASKASKIESITLSIIHCDSGSSIKKSVLELESNKETIVLFR